MKDEYAVTVHQYLREEIRPFGGCYLVVRKTNKYVWVMQKDKDGDFEKKIGMSRVVFFTDHDITDLLKAENLEVERRYEEHVKYVRGLISLYRKTYKGGDKP